MMSQSPSYKTVHADVSWSTFALQHSLRAEGRASEGPKALSSACACIDGACRVDLTIWELMFTIVECSIG